MHNSSILASIKGDIFFFFSFLFFTLNNFTLWLTIGVPDHVRILKHCPLYYSVEIRSSVPFWKLEQKISPRRSAVSSPSPLSHVDKDLFQDSGLPARSNTQLLKDIYFLLLQCNNEHQREATQRYHSHAEGVNVKDMLWIPPWPRSEEHTSELQSQR